MHTMLSTFLNMNRNDGCWLSFGGTSRFVAHFRKYFQSRKTDPVLEALDVLI
jgi:hypothetical protein